MAIDRLGELFELQATLQRDTYGKDPGSILDPQVRVQFIKDMVLAAEDELHELLGEVGWKPWATSRHINEEEYKGELVDLLHFFLNLCLVVNMTPDELHTRYVEKRTRNKLRQAEGYDGISGKCFSCHRGLDDLAKAWKMPVDSVFSLRYWSSQGRQTKRPVAICEQCAEESGERARNV